MHFYLPTRFSFHRGSMPDFTGILDQSASTLFVVSGTLFRNRPDLISLLPDDTVIYSEVDSNPDIRALQEVVVDPGIRQVVGLGGGSKLDAAKVLFARALTGDEHSIIDLVRKPALFDEVIGKRHEYKLVQLPTTFGSSAEITKWGTVWDWANKHKYSISHDLLYADYALIYPDLSLTAPFDVTAYTGLDTLSHAIESYWNVEGNSFSRMMSMKSIETVLDVLPRLLKAPDSSELRHAMAEASVFAGMAFSQTKTAAAHAISYPLTLYHDIPHGYACSLTLGAIFDLNLKRQPALEEILVLFRRSYGTDTSTFSECFQSFLAACGVPSRFSSFNVTEQDIPRLVSESFHPERVNNMYHKLMEEDIRNILLSVL